MPELSGRQILAGALALNANLMPPTRLAASMNSCTSGKQLGDLLEECGALDPAQRTALNAAIEQHVTETGDVASSIASPGIQAALRRLIENGLDLGGDSQFSSHSVAPETPHNPNFGNPTSSGGRFQVMREHARGGLGEVHVARDLELGREVALKAVQERFAGDPNVRSRFLLEAEITGGLEHPGVVPVYGLGTHADGRPYYAMRFIRGDSLTKAIEKLHAKGASPTALNDRMFQLRQLLNRYVTVCNTMAYAHSRGVVHRDLKPDNIMLGPYGETLVVDWGLAKLVGAPEDSAKKTTPGSERDAAGREVLFTSQHASDSPQTQFGAVVGTPVFMSPEQAAGLADQMGPATDIYGLGATLYAILTGRAPFERKPVSKLLPDVIIGRFPPPRKVNARIPPAMEAICLKAMRMDPKRRYASAREMADDLEAWLADEPVKAWKEPWRMRAGRWMRRHRPLVAGITATVLIAVVSLAAGVVLLTAANRREEKAKLLAETRGEEARNNFEEALKVVHFFCTKVGNDPRLEDMGKEAFQRDMLEKAREVLERFFQQNSTDLKLDSETADAMLDLEYIMSKTGDKQRGIDMIEKARDRLDNLVRVDPNYPMHAIRRARAYLNLGVAYVGLERYDEGRKTLETARQLAEELKARDPKNLQYSENLAFIYTSSVRIAMHAQHFDEAVAAAKAAIENYEQLLQADPHNHDYACYLIQELNNLGIVNNNAGNYKDAQIAFEKARDTLEKTREKVDSGTPVEESFLQRIDIQRLQLANELGLGKCYTNLPGKSPEAKTSYEAAIRHFAFLAKRHEDVPDYQIGLSEAHSNLGQLFARELKDYKTAASEFDAANQLLKPLISKHPENGKYRDNLIVNLSQQAQLQERVNENRAEIERLYREAIKESELLVQQFSQSPNYLQREADSYANLGYFLLRDERYAEACATLKMALAAYQRLEQLGSQLKDIRLWQADIFATLGRAYNYDEKPAEALTMAEQARALFESIRAQGVNSNSAKNILHTIQVVHAGALSRLGRHEEALAEWDELIDSEQGMARVYDEFSHTEALSRAGKHFDAVKLAGELKDSAAGSGDLLYRLAAIHARAAAADDPAKVKTPKAEHDPWAVYRWSYNCQEAAELLYLARYAGYFKLKGKVQTLAKDPAFEALRGRGDFRELLKE